MDTGRGEPHSLEEHCDSKVWKSKKQGLRINEILENHLILTTPWGNYLCLIDQGTCLSQLRMLQKIAKDWVASKEADFS